MIIEKALQALGLSEKESKLYLAALERGADTVQNLAKSAGVNRPTAYTLIESLKRKGLMSEHDQANKSMYIAENPEILGNLIEQEELKIKFQKQELTSVLPELLSKYSSKEAYKPKVRFFEGEEGISQIRKEFLKKKNIEIYAFLDYDKVDKFLVPIQSNTNTYVKDRVNRNITSYTIWTGSKRDDVKEYDEKLKRHTKHLKDGIEGFPADVTVFDDSVSLISYSKHAVGVVINDKAIADMLKALFKVIWDKI